MEDHGLFFSLRWKLTILFGVVFLLLQSVFSYTTYVNVKDDFEQDRRHIQANHVNLAETLTKDSSLVLEQFAELVSVATQVTAGTEKTPNLDKTSLDENWNKWQLIWDIENIVFFDKNGKQVKSLGHPLINSDGSVRRVLDNEMPEHKVFCPDNCYQQALIPVLDSAGSTGVLSVIRPFSEVIIKYHKATGADLGVLVPVPLGTKNPDNGVGNQGWRFKLSAITRPEKNNAIFNYVVRHYAMEEFFERTKRVEIDREAYDIGIVPVQHKLNGGTAPYFLFLDNVTGDLDQLDSELKKIWFFSLLSLLASLLLFYLASHVFLRRVSLLSEGLPLLSQNQFGLFRQQIKSGGFPVIGYDELDKLNLTALSLADQLEQIEQVMRGHTFNLLEKSDELAKERDFIKQLIELAPIIIIIQKLNGIIITINQTGLDVLGVDIATVIGQVFDVFIPDSDKEHLSKLNRLRLSASVELIKLDGAVRTETGKLVDISWQHKLLPAKETGSEAVILTLGMDISERKLSEARNIRMAYYDYLTGLGNRRKFHEEFSLKLASAERYGYQLALFYLDLDRFKEINDTSGHDAGDNFLKMVADTLKATVRSTDLICRLGGDEFTLIMPHADNAGILNMAKKINRVLKQQVFQCDGNSYSASASIGISVYPVHGTSVSELMANADLAMYRAKELGRGQHHMFSLDYDYRSKSNQIVYWRKILEAAIEEDKFILLYQPILNIKTNQISHYECLVRLQQDEGKLFLPADFVYRAEELGLISRIDRIVLKKAIEKQIEFKALGKSYKLSVNISRRSFEDPGIFDDFAKLLATSGIDPEMIVFEITDTVAVANYKSTNQLINQLKNLGCMLALNDFGVEYPSLHYLKNAPVDYVKIDGSLVKQISKSPDDKIFVKALTEIAQAFGKKTVAEFVENEDILEILKEFGIDYAQGYYIGKPQTFEPE
jgi:diguanylate cyclase (GGDEF)-like protein/PAS domain S-box-containing protein